MESWSLERFADHWLKHVVGPAVGSEHIRRCCRQRNSHVMPTALREAADAMDRVFVQPN